MQNVAKAVSQVGPQSVLKTAEAVFTRDFIKHDDIPTWLLPGAFLIWTFCTLLAISLRAFVKATVRVEISGLENREKHQNFIYCCWHEDFYTAALTVMPLQGKSTLITNNHWMTVPLRWFARWLGVNKFILTSKNSEAKNGVFGQCLEDLASGYNMLITPDGGGRRRHIRGQIVRMAEASKVAILPVEFVGKGVWRMRWTWDQKVMPLPFARIKVTFKDPILVNASNVSDIHEVIAEKLGPKSL